MKRSITFYQTGNGKCRREIHHGCESVNLAESKGSLYRLLCLECFNREMAADIGNNFQYPQFSEKIITDAQGKKHLFRFATRFVDTDRVSIEAYEEDVDNGYRFQVLGKIEKVQ